MKITSLAEDIIAEEQLDELGFIAIQRSELADLRLQLAECREQNEAGNILLKSLGDYESPRVVLDLLEAGKRTEVFEQERDRLRAALKIYADKSNWLGDGQVTESGVPCDLEWNGPVGSYYEPWIFAEQALGGEEREE